MAITKTEILEAIPTDKAQLDSYTRTLCLLNDTKTYVTDNL